MPFRSTPAPPPAAPELRAKTAARAWEEQAWQTLQNRSSDAGFFYGVTTTGVYCRPGCASRMPLRANTRFFTTVEEAEEQGFRPCRRCKPQVPAGPSAVARMCAHLAAHSNRAVTLAELGRRVKLSPFTAQRLFKAAMGATPAQYQRALRAAAWRKQLQGGKSVTEAIYEAGYGSSSRAYEQSTLGMAPTRFREGGKGETIRYAVAEAAGLGHVIVGSTERGICWVAIAGTSAEAVASLHTEFPNANLAANQELQSLVQRVVAQIGAEAHMPLPLDLRGTAFQLKVWSALQAIPRGETRTYSQLAAEMGMPAATRAVARACALNRVSVLVPCHRVVGVSGSLTGYRWGVDRKKKLLETEASNQR